jgi:hypothetical protein
LVVSHSMILPRLLKALEYPLDAKIAEDGQIREYDNIFVIIPKGNGSPLVLRLRY